MMLLRFPALLFLLLSSVLALGQAYFPPNQGNQWETIDPQTLGWNVARLPGLYQWLSQANTRAFIILKDGKIVVEQYFNRAQRDSLWMWASAGKGITAFLAGIAVQEGKLRLSDRSSVYLGPGWTSAPRAKEDLITVWNQLTMTNGLNDLGFGFTCITPNCLRYVADAGTRWAYHNGPYSLMEDVLIKANQISSYNALMQEKLKNPTGMDGTWVAVGPNNIYYSRARSMARFGLLMLHQGNWNGQQLLRDSAYFRAMIRPSQSINPSYGYLWWLNGQSAYLRPQSQTVFTGMLCPNAPADMYAAMGAKGQIINIVPSLGLVVVRMGETPDDDYVPVDFQNAMWAELRQLFSPTTAVAEPNSPAAAQVWPNPFHEALNLDVPAGLRQYWLYRSTGQLVQQGYHPTLITNQLPTGVYFLRWEDELGRRAVKKVIKTGHPE